MLISIVNSRIVTILKNRIVVLSFLLLLTLLPITGCDNALASKPTEIEARAILNELSQVKQNPHTQNPLPEMYRQPPQRLKVKDGVKLFYFTKHHTADKLASLITPQLGNKTSQSSPTNQLIVHCADDADVDMVLGFLERSDVPPIQVNIDLLAAFPGASLRETTRSTFGLNIGYWENITGHQFRAVVDLLISRGYLKVLLNPTLETVNGKTATVSIRDHAPIEKTVTGPTFEPYVTTEYEWVEDTLTVTPSVFSDGSIGLKTDIKIGSRSKPEGVVQTSIITERSITVEENRIEPGKSLVIGGMRKSEKRDVIRGVPFFKDLPIVGMLFSSKDYEEKATEIIFILTPSISSGGVDHAEIVEEIRKKHTTLKYDPGLGEILADPLGTGAYAEHLEEQALEAEAQKIKAEIDVRNAILAKEQAMAAEAEAEKQMAVALTETEKAKAEAAAAKAAADVAGAQAEIVRAAAEKAKAEAIAEKTAAQKARASAETEKTAAEKIKAEVVAEKTSIAAEKASATAEKVAAEQAKAEANVAKTASEQAKAEAETAKTASEKATAEAETAKTASERTTAEAEAAKATAEKAKAEAEAAKAAAEKAKAEAEAAKAKADQQNQAPPPAQTEN